MTISPQDKVEAIIAKAKAQGADAADALYYASSSLSASRRLRKPEGLERSESSGIGLRVFIGQRSATVSSSDVSDTMCQEMVTRALAMARVAPEDPYAGLLPAADIARHIPSLDIYDPKEPSPSWLQEQCALAEDAALSVQGVTNSEGADASYGTTQFALATSEGFTGAYQSSHASCSVSVIAGEGEGMERDYAYSTARHVEMLTPSQQLGQEAASRALKKLHPRKISSQQLPVLFDPRVSKQILGNFSSAINGAAIARGTSFLKDALHTSVFSSAVSIVDDPHIIRGIASRPFDGEGAANRAMKLVDQGVMTTWLLDVRSARQLGMRPTGHASRGLSSAPSPATSNLFMQPGTLTPIALMSDVRAGLYVTELFGMGVNLVTGDYSQGASGFWIEQGVLAYPVSEITIAGKLKDMFASLTPANDLVMQYGTNAPTLRIEGMMVAGK